MITAWKCAFCPAVQTQEAPARKENSDGFICGMALRVQDWHDLTGFDSPRF
jgi:hypothetical protein